jgi:(1->4)-alpha-D-glucan 1-alpha-D-glucosylmutase
LPIATYRLQITADFPLPAAAALVPYLRDLGVSHLYSSPLLQARRGSSHGYDVVDPTRIDEARGGEAGLAALSTALDAAGMGLLLDVVPNHMAATVENPWWRDLLARGRASSHAAAFDVDWETPGLAGKLLLPVLGEPLGEALASGALRLAEEEGAPAIAYHDLRLPLSAESAREVTANGLGAYDGKSEEGLARLDALLAAQHYRPAFWRLAGEHLHYRRFFDVADLVGVRVEDEAVFAATHARLLALWREGRLHGLRIDHVDGLRHPRGYLQRLRAALGDPDAYVVVEKILSPGEELPEDWPCHGATGYGFANALTSLFVEPAGLAALDRVYVESTGVAAAFQEIRYGRKKQVLRELFGAELGRLGRRLAALAAGHRSARDLTHGALATALVEVTACLPVYRTYVREEGPGEGDRAWLATAFGEARRRAAGDPLLPPALDFLAAVLHLEPPAYLLDRRDAWLSFVRDWQQTTGAVMAKGLEDTALYVHARLLSLNAVGGQPPGVEPPGNVGAFHQRNRRRRERWPAGMSATSTHDSKRSEDVVARLNVLAELTAEWERRLARWRTSAAAHKRRLAGGREAPDGNEELYLYQTLLGAWPLRDEEQPAFAARIEQHLRKALREAKTHSSWLQPDEEYEAAVIGFAAALLRAAPANDFRTDFRELADRIAVFGAWCSLAQVVLKVASPGVPDFYQGTELWDFSLVDPDNRRPVDFTRRRRLLAELQCRHDAEEGCTLLDDLLAHWRDGRVKLYVTWRALQARSADPDLFLAGDYRPLLAEGDRARHLVAFARQHEGRWLLAVVPRWVTSLVGANQPPIGEAVWADTWLPLPDGAPARWRDTFNGRELVAADGRLPAGAALASFPVALLLG